MRYVLFFWLVSFSSLLADPIVYLTWQRDPTSTMTIQWLTKSDETSDALEYSQDDSLWKKCEGAHSLAPNNEPYLIHRLELTGLKADTVYRFRLLQHEYRFRTLPKTLDEPLRFIVGGDLCDNSLEIFTQTALQAASRDPRFVLIGGDITYSVANKKADVEDFSRWLLFLTAWTKTMRDSHGLLIPFVPAIGNHEVVGYFDKTPDAARFFYALFSMPGVQGYNMLRAGSYFSLAILDSGHTHPVYGAQTDWLKKELSSQPSFLHRFAIYHVPAYPSARYFRGRISSSIRRNWCPLFETYGIHAAFEHHDHAYKRTLPLIDTNVDPLGVVYFGDGCWGAKPRVPKNASRTSFLAKTACTRQFIQVDLTKTKRTFQAIGPNDAVIDCYEQTVGKPNLIG